MPSVLPRNETTSNDDDNSSTLSPVYIAGIALISAIVLGVAIWLTVRQLRVRVRRKRESARGAAFLSVRGVVNDEKKEDLPEYVHPVKGTFSRDQLTKSVVLPDKVLIRPSASASPAEIIDYHRQSGNFPQPSLKHSPFSFALNAAEGASRPFSGANRGSWVSFLSASGSGPSRFSVISSASSVESTNGTVRKIRQLFNPILPDELLVTAGEKLHVLQSFDDGWCVVARENGNTFVQAKSLFKQPEPSNNMEVGVVPAWCFLKPVVGLKGERPIRSSSLGITVQMEGPGFSSREEIISWSNF